MGRRNVREEVLVNGHSVHVPDIREYARRLANELPDHDIINNELYTKYDVKRGLRNANGTGVLVGLTRVGDVVGYKVSDKNEKIPIPGKLYYRGYDIEELVKNCIKEERFGFEESTYLLLFGELPTRKELDEFCALLASKRELPAAFARSLMLNPSPNVMNRLARNVLGLYSYDPQADDISVENVVRQSIELIGYFPAMICYAYQVKSMYYDNTSLYLHYPSADYGTAQNILHMIRPNGEFTDLEARLLDLSLILHSEHGGGNNSSFTTHLLSSSGTDTYSTIAAAIGSLKGPRHGGANIAVINMMRDLKANVADITNEKQVEEYLIKVLKKQANDGSGLIYGLGHAIYTVSDPRAVTLKAMAQKLAKEKHLEDDFMLCDFIEKRGPELFYEVTGIKKPMPANVDLYSGFVYSALNIPNEVATPLFAMARLSGWCAHRLEELISGKRLIRPAYKSVQEPRKYVPMSER